MAATARYTRRCAAMLSSDCEKKPLPHFAIHRIELSLTHRRPAAPPTAPTKTTWPTAPDKIANNSVFLTGWQLLLPWTRWSPVFLRFLTWQPLWSASHPIDGRNISEWCGAGGRITARRSPFGREGWGIFSQSAFAVIKIWKYKK